jgi:hypothetical protein
MLLSPPLTLANWPPASLPLPPLTLDRSPLAVFW